MNKLTEQQLRDNLVGWRDQRAISKNSTADAQLDCFVEERREFMDALGDMAVCIINAEALGYSKHDSRAIIDEIESAASQCGVDIEECYGMVWDVIKNRIGLTRSTGKWTKWEDLTHEERLIVARSGQFEDKPYDVVIDANKYCTTEEWNEIVDAAGSLCYAK